MSSHSNDIQSEIKGYVIIGVSLLALTIVTVAISYLRLNLAGAIAVALVVATIKGSLVACYFMHLISEKKLIYIVLVLTVIAISGLPLLTMYSNHDAIFGTKHIGGEASAPAAGDH